MGRLLRTADCRRRPVRIRQEMSLLMRDVAPWLIPATDASIMPCQHALFLRHMAALRAEFWDCGPEFDVVPAMRRYLELSPWTAAAERAAGSTHLVPR